MRPLAELARAAGLPESTARRYARGPALPYLTTQAAGRFILYDLAVSVPVLRRVAELFRRGQGHAKVAEILAREFQPIMELVPAVVEDDRHTPPRDTDNDFAPALAEILAAYNALRAELAEERAARVALESKLAVLESELVAGKRRQREFERVVEGKLKR